MCHAFRCNRHQTGIIQFIHQTDIFVRRNENAFCCVVFHDNFCTALLNICVIGTVFVIALITEAITVNSFLYKQYSIDRQKCQRNYQQIN